MIDTIVYDKNSQVTGIALLKSGEVKNIEIISGNQAISGNVYLGKITKKVLLAHDREGFFVNIGDGKEAFLNGDEYGMNEAKLVEGQSVVVQVAQERHAEKNARLVRSIQLVGTYVVYCPYRMDVGASNKIEDKNKVAELIEAVKGEVTGQEGWVLRTAAGDVDFSIIAAEMKQLRDTFENIRIKARNEQAPYLLYSKPDSILEYINFYKNSLEKVITNNHNLKDVLPDNIECVISSSPFEEYGVDEVIGEALEKTVVLKHGGRVTIEETKACVAIDVDSGKDNGGGALNRLNEEAAYEIAKQIRLRNLSGKIVVDFAGHSEYRYIKPLLEILEKELNKDMTKSRVVGLSHGGLVEIIRVRKRPTLQELMSEECPTCQGTGRVEKGE
ncbi:MAG: ribonuclease E/G [Alphaproteobacteria bacterium]|nr:ribonuclease E/G [Alphaproteobacteria bacterium]